MNMDYADKFKKLCGRIFVTQKGLFAFKCALCGQNFGNCEEFLSHFTQAHNTSDFSTSNADFLEASTEISSHYDDIDDDSQDDLAESATKDYLILNKIVSKEEKRSDPPGDCCSVASVGYSDEPNGDGVAAESIENYNCDSDLEKYAIKEVENIVTKVTRQNDDKDRLYFTTYDTFLDEEETFECEYDDYYKVDQSETNHLVTYVSKEEKKIDGNASDNDCVDSSGVKHFEDTVLYCKQAKCLQCAAIFTDINEFREHMKEHNYICTICSKGFLSKEKLELHTLSALKNCKSNMRPHKCPLCGFSFRRKANLHVHKMHHVVDKKFQCKYCLKKFETGTRLRLHMRSHTNDRPYKCHICGTTMTNLSNMNNHVIRHFEVNKKFQCEQCPKAFFMRTELNLHTRAVHTSERPYLCSDCGRSFPTQGSLTAHKKRHEARNYVHKCDICSKTFFNKPTLNKHMSAHGKREHACSTCGAAFKQLRTLINHMKIHENKREYKCRLCDKAFNQSSALTAHIRNVHYKKL